MGVRYLPTSCGRIASIDPHEVIILDVRVARATLDSIKSQVAKWAPRAAESKVDHHMLAFWSGLRDELTAALAALTSPQRVAA